MSNSKKDDIYEPSAFTVDSERTGQTQMPSVTKLLNRKTLVVSTTSLGLKSPSPATPSAPPPASKPPTLPPAIQPAAPISKPPAAPPSLDLMPPIEASERPKQNTPASPPPMAQPASLSTQQKQGQSKIQPASRRGRRSGSQPPLPSWELSRLKQETSPLGRALHILFSKGVSQALLLTAFADPGRPQQSQFRAELAVNPTHRLAVWNGLIWNPQLTPEVWNHLSKAGFMELSPASSTTAAHLLVRSALGLTSSEWLVLVRCGTPKKVTAILALVSKNATLGEIPALMPLLESISAETVSKPLAA